MLLDELLEACQRWERELADELAGTAAPQDAAVTVIGIIRRLATTLTAH